MLIVSVTAVFLQSTVEPLCTKERYRNLWMMLGVTAMGLRIGNKGLMALGLPMGMGFGVAIRTSLAKITLHSNYITQITSSVNFNNTLCK
jgi:hypothetical protein